MATNLHFLMIPLMCPGHVIPMVDMAKLLALRSVTVTLVVTPRNAARYCAILDRAVASGLPIRTLQLQFPATEAGLPEGCESVDDLPTFALSKNFFDASSLLQQPLEEVFSGIRPRPSCILSDKHLVWTADTAKKFQIPWVMFDGMSCFTQLCTHNLYESRIHEKVNDTEPFVLPGLPDCIKMTKNQLPGLFNPGNGAISKTMKDARVKVRETEVKAYGVVINSFEELEKRYVDEFRKVKGDKVWCIGPFSLSNKDGMDKAQRGNRSPIEEHKYLSWLDSQKQGSVIYACLGSLTRLSTPQFMELALGIEESKLPFILVVRGSRAEEIEKWLAEEGFEERVEGRGFLIRGWAPQVLILSHPAVGGFLTHCGWNSAIEGVCAGVPMITWPLFAEQFFNERLAVQVVGTGVSVGVQRTVYLGEEEAAGVQVRREDVSKAIKTVMDEGREGEERRKRAKDFAEMAKKAVEEGGSSEHNVTLLIQDILRHANRALAG